jgi:serine/threonine protein kinase
MMKVFRMEDEKDLGSRGVEGRFDIWEQQALERAGCSTELAEQYSPRFSGFQIAYFFENSLAPETIDTYLAEQSGAELAWMVRNAKETGLAGSLAHMWCGAFKRPGGKKQKHEKEAEPSEETQQTLGLLSADPHERCFHSKYDSDWFTGPGKSDEEFFATDYMDDSIDPSEFAKKKPGILQRLGHRVARKMSKLDEPVPMYSGLWLFYLFTEDGEETPEFREMKTVLKEKMGGTLLDEIGSGNHGRVFKYRNGSVNSYKAMKILSANEFGNIRGEVEALDKLGERGMLPFMPRFNWLDSFRIGTETYYYIMMDYIEGKSLGDTIQERRVVGDGLPYRLVELYSMQMLQWLEVLQEKRMVHGDLTTENIRITDDDRLYFIDFGTARTLDDVLEGKGVDCNRRFGPPSAYSHNPDMFALGHLMYSMMSGRTLFTSWLNISPKNREKIKSVKDESFYDKRGDISKKYMRLLKRIRNKHSDHLVDAITACLSDRPVSPGEIKQMIMPGYGLLR